MKYVIIGGDAAGMSAAMQIARNGKNAEILTLEKGEIYSYGQCGLPYVIKGTVSSTNKLIARKLETFREKHGIDARINHDVARIDPNKKIVSGIDHAKGKPFTYAYDKLLIATGARPIEPKIKGTNLSGVHVLKTIPDANQIVADLAAAPQHAVIIGGGYIGLEVAEALNNRGLKVKIIEHADRIGKLFDADMSAHLQEEAGRHGISVHTNEEVKELTGSRHVTHVHTDKGTYPADIVVLSVGIQPNNELISETGIETGTKNAIRVNPFMETNVPDIYAAGDCALQYHLIKEKMDYIPLGTNANKQGRIAGMNLIGQLRLFKGVVGTSIIKFMDLTAGRTGLSEEEADTLDIPYQSIQFDSTDRTGYYPGSEPIHIKLVYHQEDERLLGGQFIGRKGVDKRVDVLATALYHRMQLHDLEDLDLSYAPPYNSVWDPLQQTARRG